MPRKIGPRKIGPRKIGPRKIGPRKIGPKKIRTLKDRGRGSLRGPFPFPLPTGVRSEALGDPPVGGEGHRRRGPVSRYGKPGRRRFRQGRGERGAGRNDADQRRSGREYV